MFEPIRQIFRSQTFQKSRQILVFFKSKLNVIQLIFILLPHHLHRHLSVRALLYFLLCFYSNYCSPLTPSCSHSLPLIVPGYRPVSSILQCPDVLLSLRISLHSTLLLSYLKSIGLLGSSFLCRSLRPFWPVYPLS